MSILASYPFFLIGNITMIRYVHKITGFILNQQKKRILLGARLKRLLCSV